MLLSMSAEGTVRASTQETLAVLGDDTRVGAILSPLRREILGRLHREADSATGLSRKMGL